MRKLFALALFTISAQAAPMRVLVAGVSHGHVDWILSRNRPDLEIVGIQDENLAHARSLAHRYGIEASKVFGRLTDAIEATRPEGLLAFGGIDEHLEVVRAAVPRKLPVMVEKPLAHDLPTAIEIARISRQEGLLVLVNYETTWYPALERAFEFATKLGSLRKVEVRAGHRGPVELGVKPEFLHWLTDPNRGGGALMDFGCYGLNILTKLRKGEAPSRVSALTFTNKPARYARVEDEATILLQYSSGLQGIVQGSWNWPFSRKDATFYGEKGYVIQHDRENVSWKNSESASENHEHVPRLRRADLFDDPFAYFVAAARGQVAIEPWDLSSLDNNLLVMRILDAARRSAQSAGQPQRLR